MVNDINIGRRANDGKGDSLRVAGKKINEGFRFLRRHLEDEDSHMSSEQVEKLETLKNTQLSDSLESDSKEIALNLKGAKELRELIANISFLDENTPPYLLDTDDADAIPDTMRFTFKGGGVSDVNLKVLFDLGVLKEISKGDDYTLNLTTLGGSESVVSLKSWFDKLPKQMVGSNSLINSFYLNQLYPFSEYPVGTRHFETKLGNRSEWVRVSEDKWQDLPYLKVKDAKKITVPNRNYILNSSKEYSSGDKLSFTFGDDIESIRDFLGGKECYLSAELEVEGLVKRDGAYPFFALNFDVKYLEDTQNISWTSGLTLGGDNLFDGKFKLDRFLQLKGGSRNDNWTIKKVDISVSLSGCTATKAVVKNIFLGIGNLKTDYSPAPEDLEEKSKLYLADENGIVKKNIEDKKLKLGNNLNVDEASGVVYVDDPLGVLGNEFILKIGEDNRFKAIRLELDSAEAYNERVVLLLPIVSGLIQAYNSMYGKIIASKKGGNVWDTFDISAQSVWNNTFASFTSQGQRHGHKLVTCMYNGVQWIALKFSYSSNPYNNYWFEGFHVADSRLDSDNDALKVISYYKKESKGGAAEVLNTEINSSIQDYTSLTYSEFSSELHVNGKIKCVSLIQTSDKKYKNNIEEIDGEWALEVFKKLKFSFYDFSKTNSKQAGLIAQEVEKILPEAVHTAEGGEKGLNHTYIDMICKAGIQFFIKTKI